MKRIDPNFSGRAAVLLATLLANSSAHAYIGPGAGLSVIGSALALIGALVLMIVGFFWYPIKRIMKRRKPAAAEPPEASQGKEPVDSPLNPEQRPGSRATQTTEL